MNRSRRALALITIALTALAVLTPIAPAQAAGPVGHTQLVPAVPRTDTPVVNGAIEDIVQWDDRVVLLGTFTQIRNRNGAFINQPYIAAYNIDTGLIDQSFRPTVDRPVLSAAVSADGNSLYLVGMFNTINGIGRRKIARLNPNGSLDTGLTANANSRVTSVVPSSDGQHLYVGGFFARINGVDRGLIAKLDANTGAVDPAFDLPITEGIGANALLKVQSIMLAPSDSRLIVVHTGNRVDGLLRESVVVIDTNTNQVDDWQTDLWTDNLPRVGGVTRVTKGDISPDGTYFVVVSGSGGDRPPISDTAMAFPVDGGPGVEPLWVSRNFDSVYSVAITEVAVYVGGHMRWQEAPGSPDPWPGDDDVNYGWDAGIGASALGDEVVRREQIGGLDPDTGKSMPWTPGSNSLVGVQALTAVPRGLLVYHDGAVLGGENIGSHGFFDFATVPDPGTPETTITDPWPVETLDGLPFLMMGAASADGGVAGVEIDVRNNGTNEYLQDDLVSWAPGLNTFDASTLLDPGAAYTVWTQNLEGWETGTYRIRARTYEIGGASDPTQAVQTVEVDAFLDFPPTTEIIYPALGDPPPTTNTFTMTGTAADDFGVASVSVVVKNMVTLQYLQPNGTMGPNFVRLPATVDNPGALTTAWSIELTVPSGSWRITAAATDTAGQMDNGFRVTQFTLDPDNEEPQLFIDFPPPFFPLEANTSFVISGTASDESAIDRVELVVQNQQTTLGIQPNGNYGVLPTLGGWVDAELNGPVDNPTWTLQTPNLPPGFYVVTGWAIDDVGARTLERPVSFFISQVPGDFQPDTTFDQAGYDQDRESLDVNLSGTAMDDIGVARVAVTIRETFQQDLGVQGRRYVDENGGFAGAYTEIDTVMSGPAQAPTWSLSGLTLPEPSDYTITVKAVDGSDQYDIDQTGATARWLIFPGDPDPYTWIQGPNEGDNPPSGPVILSGRAFDDVDPTCSPGFTCGVQRVEVQIVNSAGLFLDALDAFTPIESWLEVFLTNPGGQFSNWSYSTSPLTDDDYTIRARAVDINGQIDQTVNPFPADPGQEPDFINITVGTGPPLDVPELTLAKTALQSSFMAAGQTIDYEYELTNTGDVVLDGPFTATDDRTTVSCPGDGSLPIGSSITCTSSYVTTPADVAAGSITNTATAHASYNTTPVDSNVDTATVTLFVEAPQLSLAASVSPTTYDDAEVTLDFGYLLTNTGNVALDGPFTVTSDLGAVSCPGDTTLGLGASITCSASYTTDAGDVTAGSVTSNATAAGAFNGSPVNSNPDSATATYEDPPPPSPLAFRAVASTSGNRPSHTVTVPSGVQDGDVLIMAISVNNAIQTISNPAGWTVLDTQADGSMQTRVWYRVAAGDAGSTVTITLGARQKADIVIAGYSGADTANPILGHAVAGQAGSSTTHVTPTLVTPIDGGLIVSYWGEKNSSTTSMTTTDATVRHANSMSGGGAITALLADSNDGVTAGTHGGLAATANAESGRATMWTIALNPGGPPPPPAPGLSLVASVDPVAYGDAGLTLDFSYLLTNTGNVVLDGPFTVTSDLGAVTCPGDTALGLGASLTCSASYTTDAGDVTAGAVTSNASAAGAYDGSPVGSNGDSATATYDPPVTGDIAFRAAASTSGNTTSHTVTVPGAVEDGDFMLAFISVNNASTSVSTPTGWSLLDTQVDGTMQTRVFTRIAAGDAGSEVTVTLGARYKADLVMVAYSGVDAASPILGYASAGQAGVSATHVTPMLITGVDGAMIISYWADKTSATTTMTPSAGVTRHFNSMSGGGRITALLVDGGTTVAAGNHGGLTATADATAGKATMWTIALQAAG